MGGVPKMNMNRQVNGGVKTRLERMIFHMTELDCDVVIRLHLKNPLQPDQTSGGSWCQVGDSEAQNRTIYCRPPA